METLVKRNGLTPSVSKFGLLPSVNTFLEDFFSRDIFDWTDRNYAAIGSNLPSVNLRETDTKLEIEMAVPGMKKEDFKVEIENNLLVISSEREEEKEELSRREDFVRKEFNFQSFYRSFTLPEYADENKIEANYKEGILHVTVGKKETGKRKTTKTIAIK